MNKKVKNKKTIQTKNKPTLKVKSKNTLWVWGIMAFILVVTSFVYFKAIGFNLLNSWDDDMYVTINNNIKALSWTNIKFIFSHFYFGNYQPVTLLFYALDNKIGNGNPSVFHFNNILLHVINTFLVFILVKKISPKSILPALISAAFFGVHPMHVESVVFVAERKDVLYSFFFLLALISYSNYLVNKKVKFLLLTAVLFILSCLSKSAAVILPLLMMLLDYYASRKFNRKVLLEKIPFFAISLVFGILAILSLKEFSSFENMAPDTSLFERTSIVSFSFISYFLKAFVPFQLSAIYAYPVGLGKSLPLIYYFSFFFVFIVLAFVWYSKKWGKEIVFGFLFFIITIILVLQFVPVGAVTMADRYTYIPFIGLFFIFAKFIEKIVLHSNFKKYSKLIIPSAILYFIGFSTITYSRVKVWENDETLFTDAINKYPDCGISYRNRGSYYMNFYAGKIYAKNPEMKEIYIKKAINDFEKNVKLSFTVHDKSYAYYNLGVAKAALGDYESAIKNYDTSIEIEPYYNDSYHNRGVCYINYYVKKVYINDEVNRELYIRKSVSDFENSLKYGITKDNWRIYDNMGTAKGLSGDIDGAIKSFDKAIELNPNSNSFLNRGVYFINYFADNIYAKDSINRAIFIKKAIGDFENSLKLSTTSIELVQIYNNLAIAKIAINDFNGAIDICNKAIQIDPNNTFSYDVRANAKYHLKKYQEAFDDYNKIIEISPNDLNALNNRNMVISLLGNIKK